MSITISMWQPLIKMAALEIQHLFVRFKDHAGNQARMSGKTLFQCEVMPSAGRKDDSSKP